MITSTVPASFFGSPANRSPLENRTCSPSRFAFRLASLTASPDTSVPYTVALGTAWATASAIVPIPVARSTWTGRFRPRSRLIACVARNSDESRGTKTPGSTMSSRPRNSVYPLIRGIGSPSVRRSTSSSKRRSALPEIS